ncbi:polysaccharide biosynthesis protein [Caproiciproducens galactitolivorans]|uniref:Putative cell division protein YtgP n=1 Tax=Caproiciproducens galactitolivorans TaxID=642589 RepID=A0A4Z0Y2D1_9FIRM|nr:polysaccharide biosynthesis protein [Caproiciproducens galactitolivorans]QEY34158.1 polysaccharide biosynthesis protein [Caproiciproducens galactitolivorans]TGJ78089.1 putative cell division protein YtgP [Caproiciproducens galactitolivorans]
MERKRAAEKQSFLHGALILMVAIALVKIIGALFKIPLAWILTPVGNGYFGNAYSLYFPIFSLATAGFPIAISRLVSENSARGRYRDIRQIHTVSIRIFLILGIVSFSIMFFGAKPYVTYAASNNPENALPAIYALAPAIFFNSLMAIYRGYYEGLRNMYPTAISEIVEALSKLVFGLTLASLIIQSGMKEYAANGTVYGIKRVSEEYAKIATLPYAAAGAIFGVTIGSVMGFLFLFLYHKRHSDGITKEMLRSSPRPLPMRITTSRLIRTAIPIALGSLAVNLSTFIDSTFLQKRINDIMAENSEVLLKMYEGVLPSSVVQLNNVPTFLFGCFSNASTLFMLVPAITQAFGVSALPSVTEAWTGGNPKQIKRSIEQVLRIVAMITVPAGLGLSVLSTPIAALLYGEKNAPTVIGKILVVLGLGAIFAAMSTPINSMLQAVGRVDLPVKLLVVGLVIKLVLNYTLVGIPEINVMGAGTGTLVCYIFITVFALHYLCRETKVRLNFVRIFFKPLLASIISVGLAYFVQKTGTLLHFGKLSTLVAIAFAGVVYMACMLWFKALTRNDILMLPRGQKIVKILEKHNWIR